MKIRINKNGLRLPLGDYYVDGVAFTDSGISLIVLFEIIEIKEVEILDSEIFKNWELKRIPPGETRTDTSTSWISRGNEYIFTYKKLTDILNLLKVIQGYKSSEKETNILIQENQTMIEYFEIQNNPKFENNPELYKLWKEDPEGFDDYLRGKELAKGK